ncbi:nuclear transport factor 2 family protein [Streptomyces sp. IBSNAI002]|uniref:nuclear transport factor 2 family protein n=1 Tax=Streptomyces sp. IBSNAI002 TaxID=3457500 RepID=UPI003FD35EF3
MTGPQHPQHGPRSTDSRASEPRTSVAVALTTYFDGLYESDTDLLAGVFHPAAVYASATEGELLHLSMAEYLPMVAQREPPVARREPRRDRIVSIEFAGPVTALARVECAIGERRFTDLLTLVRVEGRWQIIAKVFHYERAERVDTEG